MSNKHASRTKKRKLTKLEKFLFAIVVSVILLFLGSGKTSVFKKNKFFLKYRYASYMALINNNKYSEAYEYLASFEKAKMSKGDFINSGSSDEKKIAKQIFDVNGIVIKEGKGYIDRNLTICYNSSCIDKETIRSYKVWIFENGNWFLTYEDRNCLRDISYKNTPEFNRALSLIKQRLTEKYGATYQTDIYNCLDIEYADLGSAEGIFTFDPNKSSLEDLKIYVDNSYKIKDDLLTAFLLAHEAIHAVVYVRTLGGYPEMSCVDNEMQAMFIQAKFIGSLHDEEMNSLGTRILYANDPNNTPLQLIKLIADFSGRATVFCRGGSADCYGNKMNEQMKNLILSNPYYQKQCNL